MIIGKDITNKTILIYSAILSLFIIYPNIVLMLWTKKWIDIIFFFFRYLYFLLLSFILFRYNFTKATGVSFTKRLLPTFTVSTVAFFLYVFISLFLFKIHGDHYTKTLIFQYLVMIVICSGIGHIYDINKHQHEKELEIKTLKAEILQSQYEALTNQIRPHFFFNALNSLTGLVRNDDKKGTLKFIDKLSEVFRYILKSDKKGLVSLNEELSFTSSYQYLLEIRFANKLFFNNDIPDEKQKLRLPFLSLLPLFENIVQHNIIDSNNIMVVNMAVNDNNELYISNPIHKKIDP